MKRDEWVSSYAAALGRDAPSAEEVDAILDVAAAAAHASEKTAAPLACWLAGRSGLPPSELKRIAESLEP